MIAATSLGENDLVNRAYYVWISVFSLFHLSVFWTFMSGLYPSRHGVWNNVNNAYAINPGPFEGVQMWSQDLREAGYENVGVALQSYLRRTARDLLPLLGQRT